MSSPTTATRSTATSKTLTTRSAKGCPRQHLARPGELPDQAAEINASGLFEVAHIRHFDWEQVYDADGYIELLDTFCGHIAMAGWKRERLYSEIRLRLSRRPDNAVRRHWEAVLHIARRLG